ncbi:FAD-binding oxidoreductase [Actinotalea sp. K2]|uniref:FAD-binding oxidoreductase n=1 Tax=Actinotalea sp. K2 TaxID=2939438 RepID=UPI002017BE4C|nr:FAD-binding oxidoreductase [Actinotalea sp. K2]MCL3859765.1 FAD-binding oxidoreductase [Actinotalea sp. K2]
MVQTTVDSAHLDSLRSRVQGVVTAVDDPGYEDVRAVWNAMVRHRPAVVVRAHGVADVAPTIAFAREHGLELAVRGGRHNVAGTGTVDGGLVLDLRDLCAVSVDPAGMTVRVEGGATLAHVDAATAPHGLAVPLGVVSGTGVAGLTLGGGVGWLTRAYGLAADNLLQVELVTADGRTVTADATQHDELFWALHGGGGNFGVATALTFRAHRLGPEVYVGNLVYGQDRWPEVWAAFEAWTRDLPDEMTAIVTTMTPPPMLELGDEPVLIVGFAWSSPDHAAGEVLVDRLREVVPPDEQEVVRMPWVDWQSAVDPLFPHGVRAYWRNTSFDRLDEEVVDVLVRRGAEQRWVGTAFDVHHMGGAYGRVPEAATPFPRRDARFWINVYGFWTDEADDDARVAFVRGLSADLQPFATGGEYVNFQGSEASGHRVLDPRAVFGEDKYRRLVAVKHRYDPHNLFHRNHNIAPEIAV